MKIFIHSSIDCFINIKYVVIKYVYNNIYDIWCAREKHFKNSLPYIVPYRILYNSLP